MAVGCAIAKQLRQCPRAPLLIVPQGVDHLHDLAFRRRQPVAAAGAAFGIERDRGGPAGPQGLHHAQQVIAQRTCGIGADMGGGATQRDQPAVAFGAGEGLEMPAAQVQGQPRKRIKVHVLQRNLAGARIPCGAMARLRVIDRAEWTARVSAVH